MSADNVWFKSLADPKAVILLAHGLNLKPSRMDELAISLMSEGYSVLRISLGTDPEHWEDNFNEQYSAALSISKTHECPLYFLGYSLGALVGMYARKSFAKLALIAPATHTKFYVKLLSLMIAIRPQGSLLSLNLENYRARDFTTLAEYKKMISMQRPAVDFLERMDCPTLVITNKKDELVSSKKLNQLALKKGWSTLKVSNKSSPLPRKYHHLMITSESLGQSEWAKMLNKLTEHFAL